MFKLVITWGLSIIIDIWTLHLIGQHVSASSAYQTRLHLPCPDYFSCLYTMRGTSIKVCCFVSFRLWGKSAKQSFECREWTSHVVFPPRPHVESTPPGVVDEGSSVDSSSAFVSVNKWGGMYPGSGLVCWSPLWDFGGQRPLLSCPRKPLSLWPQCSRHWRARVERSATRRLSSGPQSRSPSTVPIKRKVRPMCRAGQPQRRSRSGTQSECGPLRTREVDPSRKTIWTAMENCHQGPDRSIPLTCTFKTDETFL